MVKREKYIKELTQQLRRYTKEHNGDMIDWDDIGRSKHAICYLNKEDAFKVCTCDTYTMGTVYFYTKETAVNAINDVVLPFIKAHPDFS